MLFGFLADPLKISKVSESTKLAVNTFKKDFQAVPGNFYPFAIIPSGMSELCRSWRSSHQCLIHYVTQKFLNKEKFPRGSFHMRHLKLAGVDKLNIIEKIIEFAKHDASRTHKLTAISSTFDYAPTTQQFIMVGDSGELDSEIYGEIARKYPKRIKMIFIRLVNGGKNDHSRFQVAFRDSSNAHQLPQKLFKNEDSINNHVTDDFDSQNKAMVSSMPVYYHVLSILSTLSFIMTYA